MDEDEAPVNAPKWTTAGYKGSLKTSVEKYTRRTIASSPEPAPPTAPSTGSVIDVDENPTAAAAVDEPTDAGPSTADVFFLNEDILVDENVLDIESSDDSSEETDKKKSKEKDSSEESDSSSGEEEDDDKNKGKDKKEDSGSSSSEEEEDDRDKGKNEDNKDEEGDEEGDKEDDDKDKEDNNEGNDKNEEAAKVGDRVIDQTKISIQSLLNE